MTSSTPRVRVDSDIVRRRAKGSGRTHTDKTATVAEFEIYKRAAAAGIAPAVMSVEDEEDVVLGDKTTGTTTTRFTTANGGTTLKELLKPGSKSAPYWSTPRARMSLVKAVMHRVWALHDLGICHGDLHGLNVLVRWVDGNDVPPADRAAKAPTFAYDKASRFFCVSIIDFGSAREGNLVNDAHLTNDRLEAMDMLTKLVPMGMARNREAMRMVTEPPTPTSPWNVAVVTNTFKAATKTATKTVKKAVKKAPKAVKKAPTIACDACQRVFGGTKTDDDWWFCDDCEAVRAGIETLRTHITKAFKTMGTSRQVAQKGPWSGKTACKFPREAATNVPTTRPGPTKNILPRSMKTLRYASDHEHEHDHDHDHDEEEDRSSTPLDADECEFYASLLEFEDQSQSQPQLQPLADTAAYLARLPPLVEMTTISKKRSFSEAEEPVMVVKEPVMVVKEPVMVVKEPVMVVKEPVMVVKEPVMVA